MGLDIFPQTISTDLGAFTGSSGTERAIFTAPGKCRILGVDLVDITGITANATNYGTGTIYNKGTTGSGTTVVAQRSTTATSVTAFKAWPITLSTTEANLEVDEDEVLTFKLTEAGSGQDLGGATISVHYALGTGAGN